MIIKVRCPQCGQEFSREFGDVKLAGLGAGITHLCSECWDKIFGVDEPNGYEEDVDIPQGMLDEMAEMYYEMQAEIARGK